MKKYLLSLILLSLTCCVFGQLKYKENPKLHIDSAFVKAKIARKEARFKSPVYFDTGLGLEYHYNSARNNYGSKTRYYNVAVGWQKSPWLGFGLNYSLFGFSTQDRLKSIGISWRARPRNGFLKATINVYNEFGPNFNYYLRSRWTERIHFKKRVPPGLNFEAGVRCWDMLLLKVGYQIQIPFDLEVTTIMDEVVVIDGEYIYSTTSIERISLRYFHVGIGFIL